MINDTSQRGVA